MSPHLQTLAVMIPLMAFIIWRRVRSQFGRQPIRRRRMRGRVVIFAVIALLLASSGLRDLHLLEGLIGGLVLGAALGLLGLNLTRFELDPLKGDCYIPNPWIGGLLTALLVGRLVWRLATAMPGSHEAVATHGPALGDSPLTLLVVGLTLGYYLAYFSGLLIHHQRLLSARPDITTD